MQFSFYEINELQQYNYNYTGEVSSISDKK